MSASPSEILCPHCRGPILVYHTGPCPHCGKQSRTLTLESIGQIDSTGRLIRGRRERQEAHPVEAATPSSKRPKWLRTISAFYVFSALWTGISHVLIVGGSIPLEAVEAEFYAKLTLLDHAALFGSCLVALLNAALLIMRRKQVAYVVTAQIAFGTALGAWHIATTNVLEVLKEPGIVGGTIGWCVHISVCLYFWRLVKRGVLK